MTNEIRLKLLQMAREMLEQEYQIKRDSTQDTYEKEYQYALQHDLMLPNKPTIPHYPTTQEVIAKAQELNQFVLGA